MIARKSEKEQPKSLLQFASVLGKVEITSLFRTSTQRIALINCVSLAECERNFSSMRLIKNEHRTVMKQERLDSLMMLGIHRDVNKQAGLGNWREQI